MRAFLNRLLRKLLQRTSKSVETDGLWVAADERELLFKVQDALRLIKTHDPRRYGQMLKDLDGVWVTLLTGPLGLFFHADYMCELDDRFVASASPERIASVIVHEATHAHLWRRGIRYPEDLRQRIEAICVRQQQVFESKLPTRGMSSDELASYLELPSTNWTDEALTRDDMRGSVTALRHLNVPDWLIYFVLKFRRWLSRRQCRTTPRPTPTL